MSLGVNRAKHDAWPHYAVRAEAFSYALAFIGRDAFFPSFHITNFVSYLCSFYKFLNLYGLAWFLLLVYAMLGNTDESNDVCLSGHP